ncbi:MAG: CDP-alcohol phosphatidyltransferase family protein [Thermoplasmatota archaeon]|jgi:CDP-diacylglycerol--serine O-phosphatidyltransferase
MLQKSMIKLLSVADIVTLFNVLFGFFSMIMLFLGEIRFSFSFILLAILADGLDGIVARRTRKGELGEYFEAMADMTSLGIAPAFFVYVNYHSYASCCFYYHSYLVITLVLFLLLCVIRLASFHVMKDKNFFVGLPASASTIIIITLVFLDVIPFLYFLPVVIVVSVAMICSIRFPKPGLLIDSVAAILIIFTIILGKEYQSLAPFVLLFTILVYVFAGPVYLWKIKKNT